MLEPKEQTVFGLALEKIKDDPRVSVRLGAPIIGYGVESRNRAARQRVRHRFYTDGAGVEHVQVQFYARGSSGVATVHADAAYAGREWRFAAIYADIGSPVPQRLTVVSHESPDAYVVGGAS